jgi:hypothetical protein
LHRAERARVDEHIIRRTVGDLSRPDQRFPSWVRSPSSRVGYRDR